MDELPFFTYVASFTKRQCPECGWITTRSVLNSAPHVVDDECFEHWDKEHRAGNKSEPKLPSKSNSHSSK